MNEFKPKRFNDSYEFFDWLEKHPEYELGAITLNIDGNFQMVTPEIFKRFSPKMQEAIIEAINKKYNIDVYPPEKFELIKSINNLN
jgi:hypothetical protein